MNLLHCAAQNDHVSIINFVHDSLEGFSMDEIEKVCATYPYISTTYACSFANSQHKHSMGPI